MSELKNESGIEYPTHTTSHNQVVAVKVAEPSADTIENYVTLKHERGLSWDAVASLVETQDPALADLLRAKGDDLEAAQNAVAPSEVAPPVLTELAVNPLSTPEDRAKAGLADTQADADAVAASTGPDAGLDTGQHAAADAPAAAATTPAASSAK